MELSGESVGHKDILYSKTTISERELRTIFGLRLGLGQGLTR